MDSNWCKQFRPPERNGPPPSLAYVEKLPRAVIRDLRTVDPESQMVDPEPPASELVRLATPVVEQLERAAVEGAQDQPGGLIFSLPQNLLTGRYGLIVCAQQEFGDVKRPLVQLLACGWLSTGLKANCEDLTWFARNRRLSLVACRVPGEAGPRCFVMLTGRLESGRKTRSIKYLARVLARPFEVAQWSDPDRRWVH